MPSRLGLRLLNFFLRGLSLVGKFLLIFFLARFLDPAQLGLYGLLVATVAYAIYLVGLDFYVVTTRAIIRTDRSRWGALLKSQLGLTAGLYLTFTPLLLLLFITDNLPWSVAGWFFFLLILEHLNQELTRLLVAISKPLQANFLLFLRQGAWCLVVSLLMMYEPRWRTLEFVLAVWSFAGMAAALMAMWWVHAQRIGGWGNRIDWSWIGSGLKVALPLLAATLALRALFTLDRYWLESLAGMEVLGAYVFYTGLATALVSFLDAGVFSFLYPSLIRAFHVQDAMSFRAEFKRLLIQTLLFSLCFAVLALLVIIPLLGWLDKPVYFEQQALFPWILAAIFLYALGMVPHYALYAQGHDSPLIWSHFGGLLCFILATWLSSAAWPQIAVPLGLCAGFLSILVWKTMAYFRMTPVQYRLGRVSRHTN